MERVWMLVISRMDSTSTTLCALVFAYAHAAAGDLLALHVLTSVRNSNLLAAAVKGGLGKRTRRVDVATGLAEGIGCSRHIDVLSSQVASVVGFDLTRPSPRSTSMTSLVQFFGTHAQRF